MSEENQSIFADTEPNLADAPVDDIDERQCNMMKENLMHQLDEFNPRIEQLKQNFEYLTNSAEKSVRSVGIDIIDEIQRIRPRMDSIHTNSINISKKIQSLGLTQQTVSTLSIPKQMRPVHDEFFNFKDEFDAALKNVATLSRSVTTQADNINDTLNGIKQIPDEITKALEEIENYRVNCYNQSIQINELKSKLESEILETFKSTISQFDQKIESAQKVVEEYEEKAKDGVSKFENNSKNIEEKKEDLKNSYADLSTEITKSINDKISIIMQNIRDYKMKSDNDYQQMHKKISIELDEIHILQLQDSVSTADDYITHEKELNEIEILLDRLKNLEQQVNDLKNADNRTNGGDEPQYKDYQGIWKEQPVTFRCFSDGTFEIIEKQEQE